MKIMLICGHGEGDNGACHTIDGTSYKEATIVGSFCKKLYTKMKNKGIDVTLYDTTKNAYRQLCTNSKAIIFNGYDLILELHLNSCSSTDYNGNGKNTGTEIYVPSRSGDTSNQYAKKILKAVCDVGFTNRGVKSGAFKVINTAYLNGVKNAFLLELFFLSDKDDLTLYNKKKSTIINNIANLFVESSFLFKITATSSPVYIDIKNKVKSATKVKKNEVFTIVSTTTINGIEFGKLKSGIGYIPLNIGVRL